MRRFVLLPVILAVMAAFTGVAYASCIEAYPPSIVAHFNQHCGTEAYCACVINTVQKTVPLADFIEEGSKAGGLSADKRISTITKGCVAKYPRTAPAAKPKNAP